MAHRAACLTGDQRSCDTVAGQLLFWLLHPNLGHLGAGTQQRGHRRGHQRGHQRGHGAIGGATGGATAPTLVDAAIRLILDGKDGSFINRESCLYAANSQRCHGRLCWMGVT